MKPESTTINVDNELLAIAEPILKQQGYTASEAITLFLNAVIAGKGMPIQASNHCVPSSLTRAEKLAAILALSGKYTTLTPSDEFIRQKG